MNFTQKGISAIETIIIVAVLGILLTIVTVPFLKFRQQQALENTTDAVISVLGEARAKTLAGYGNTAHSVKFLSDKIVLFGGATYDQNNTTNKLFLYETGVTLAQTALNGSASAVVFDRLKGTTSAYGTITLQSTSGQTRVITITNTGTIKRN